MKTKTIKQRVLFKAGPEEVYQALMDPEKHSRFTGSKASIIPRVGDRFTLYDEWIEGENLEIIKNKRIVQKWRGANWPQGHYSTAIFEFKKIGSGTELVFTQTGVPQEHYEEISRGWVEHYWDKMKSVLKL